MDENWKNATNLHRANHLLVGEDIKEITSFRGNMKFRDINVDPTIADTLRSMVKFGENSDMRPYILHKLGTSPLELASMAAKDMEEDFDNILAGKSLPPASNQRPYRYGVGTSPYGIIEALNNRHPAPN